MKRNTKYYFVDFVRTWGWGSTSGTPVSDEKCVFGTENKRFLKLSQEQARSYLCNMFQEFFDKKQCSFVTQI